MGEILVPLKTLLSLVSRPVLASVLCLCNFFFFLRGCIYFFHAVTTIFCCHYFSFRSKTRGRADLWVADIIFRFFLVQAWKFRSL